VVRGSAEDDGVTDSSLRSKLDQDGFLVLRDVLTPAAVDDVRGRLDRLFERFHTLSPARARDIAATTGPGPAPLKNAEINRTLQVDRSLGATDLFRTCRRIARELRGPLVGLAYDHAIAKQPRADAVTPWHQDQIYTGHRTPLRTVHFWIPLQDVDEDNGCMHFIAGSHLAGLCEHAPLRNASGGITFEATGVDLDRAHAVPLAAGGLTVHTPLTLHYTGPNRSAGVRRAWILHFGPLGWMAKLHPALLLEKYGPGSAHRSLVDGS
jgi:ectoine hydroxylase-related dioxygenase (phytanoyl-CoA dioxygenase family)